MNASRRRMAVAVVAAIALASCVALGFGAAQPVLLAYLAAYVFFLGPALGSVALLMVHVLAGDGAWGRDLRAPLLAAAGVLPLLALLLVPILLGARWLYPWVAHVAPAQAWYLDWPFFVLRAVACFALWLGLARGLRRRLPDPARAAALSRFAAGGLIIYALTISVAAVDWIMSLVPAWHSSVFGLIVASGQLLAAAALAVFCRTERACVPLPKVRQRDLGSVLLVLVLAWSYLAFMDYLTVWIADLPGETVWYLPRLQTSWRWLGVWLVLFHLLLPFAVLLSRRAKQHRRWLRGMAGVLLLGQAAYALWLVLPSLRPHGFALGWADALAWLGVGGLCWALFDLRLAQARRALEVVP